MARAERELRFPAGGGRAGWPGARGARIRPPPRPAPGPADARGRCRSRERKRRGRGGLADKDRGAREGEGAWRRRKEGGRRRAEEGESAVRGRVAGVGAKKRGYFNQDAERNVARLGAETRCELMEASTKRIKLSRGKYKKTTCRQMGSCWLYACHGRRGAREKQQVPARKRGKSNQGLPLSSLSVLAVEMQINSAVGVYLSHPSCTMKKNTVF